MCQDKLLRSGSVQSVDRLCHWDGGGGGGGGWHDGRYSRDLLPAFSAGGHGELLWLW